MIRIAAPCRAVTMRASIFISHSRHDNEIVAYLQKALETAGFNTVSDQRILRDGEPLSPKNLRAIEEAHAFILTISPEAVQSSWVQQETQYALKVRGERKKFPIVPLLLNGAELGALKWMFSDGIEAIRIEPNAEGVIKALPRVLEMIAN